MRTVLALITIVTFAFCSKRMAPTIDTGQTSLPFESDNSKDAIKADSACKETGNSKNDLTKDNLRGKVSSYKSSVHQAFLKSGKVEYETKLKSNAIHETYKFNPLGNIDDVLANDIYELFITKHLYDDKNQNVEEGIYKVVNGYPEFIGKNINKYDTDGRLIELVYFRDNSVKKKVIRKVDKENGSATEYSYDASGILTETIVLKNDDKGNELERISSNALGNVLHFEKKSYDSTNNMIFYSYKGEFGKFDCVYKYDDKNNPVDKICGAPNPRINHFDYIYDSHCNWIKRVELINNVPDNVTIRVFEYY